MKKITLTAILTLTALMSLFLAACDRKQLTAPSGLSVTDNQLSWSAVDGARGYVVEIKPAGEAVGSEKNSTRASYPVSELEEGEYEIKVKARGDGMTRKDSAWSDTFFFYKEYETGLVYTLINNDNEYEITRAGTASGTIVIEDIYKDKPVTRIADSAFRGNSRIENVVIGSNVRYIGESAFFSNSKLVSVIIPDSVQEIGVAAFQACSSLLTVTLPENVTVINDYTFAYCGSLESVTLGNAVTEIGDSAFTDCSELLEIDIPDSVRSIGGNAFAENGELTSVKLGSGLVTLGNYAFYRARKMTDLTFSGSGSLTHIGDSAFAECLLLSEVSLPEGLLSIGHEAFKISDKLETINIPKSVRRVGVDAFLGTKIYAQAAAGATNFIYIDNWLVESTAFAKETIMVLSSENLKAGVAGFADLSLIGFEKLERVTIPVTVKAIGNGTFANNEALFRFDSPANSIEIIGESAFQNCKNLVVLNLGEGLLSIGRLAFFGCTNLDDKETLIPDSVTSVGASAFMNTSLWNKSSNNNVIYAGKWVVGYKGELSIVTLADPKDGGKTDYVRGIADYAFYDSQTLNSVMGLGNVRYIGMAAFYNCIKLSSANLSRNLRAIEDYTFYNCEDLLDISIPTTLTYIGRSAFYGCTRLRGINLSTSLTTEIGDFAFYGCQNLESAVFNSGLKKIGRYAFYRNSSLVDVVIPNSVTEIGDRAFSECIGLEYVSIGSGVTRIGSSAFSGCLSLQGIIIPDSVTSIGSYAFYKNFAMKEVILGAGLKTIGGYAFYGLHNLTSVVIPASVTYIGEYAFKDCFALTSVVLAGSLRESEAYVFHGCDLLTIYTDSASMSIDSRWNSSFRPIVLGCVFSEDGTYVVSVTAGKDTVMFGTAEGGISAPQRKGFVFAGWAAKEGATVGEYKASELENAPEGTVLYAVWTVEETESESEI